MPNARPELLLEAGARHERTLEAVSSRPLFGEVLYVMHGCPQLLPPVFVLPPPW
jgi:hypothetical protein